MANGLATRACALCGGRVASAVWLRTGLRGEIERAPVGAGTLALQPMLPGFSVGDDVPRVIPTAGGRYREHRCPAAARSFSAANFNRKRRDR
jgi:hypothetical protein